ncbi:hypothetical protein B0H21DRAFT_385867 [Amylocystis lapponica]|nr:hypothetical protein B0H21DRAFT_385867 [Amylocystis lapponica]
MSDRRTLAKTARVCKAFSDPALNILWRHLFTLLPLFNLFPVSLLTFPGDPKYCLDGEVAEHDLERFQRYARRVRSVAYYGAPGPIDPSVYFYVSRELNGVSLLPCSRSLHWIQESAYDTSITTLLSPSLRALYLDLEFADSEMTKSISYNANSGQYIALEMLLERAFQVSPFLEEFTIMYLYHPPKMFPFSTLQHLSKVLFLSCSALTISHAFQTLSALPNLVHLVLDISGDDEEETQLSYCSGFLALQKLK